MVKLSEDPARHAHLSESIVSCFRSSDQPKFANGAVDFTQFADVMACQVRSIHGSTTSRCAVPPTYGDAKYNGPFSEAEHGAFRGALP